MLFVFVVVEDGAGDEGQTMDGRRMENNTRQSQQNIRGKIPMNE